MALMRSMSIIVSLFPNRAFSHGGARAPSRAARRLPPQSTTTKAGPQAPGCTQRDDTMMAVDPGEADTAGAAQGVGPAPDRLRRHWRRVRWLTAALLLAWWAASFVVVFNARAWRFAFFGWPFSFWWAAQGALLVFLALVAIYAWAMTRLDVAHGVDEQD